MRTSSLLLCLALMGPPDAGADGPQDEPVSHHKGDGTASSLAERFAALESRFETREAAFRNELRAANGLEPEARTKKIRDENSAFQEDWSAMADEVRSQIRAHPDDPDAFEGIILLPGLMRSYLDDDLVAIVREHFMDDPRMGQLCASLAGRSEGWAGEILEDVAARHPEDRVRGQATYSLGRWWRYAADQMTSGRDRTQSEKEQCWVEAKHYFGKVTDDYPEVLSVDGSFRLSDKAEAELARLANLPNLKVGKVAPEIVGEDLDGGPLRLSDHRGKVVVICFWATWCGPCMAMVPHERELVGRLEGKPFILLGVNSDEAGDREKAREAVREKRMTWPTWWDGGFRGAIQTAYDVDHWPTVYVLDARGVIRYFDVRGEELDRAVDELLSEMDSDPEPDAAR